MQYVAYSAVGLKRVSRWALTFGVLVATGVSALAADAIWFNGDPGQTLYVRVRINSTTSVAAALSPGTGNGAGFYFVTDMTLSAPTDGLDNAGVYPYKIFV